MSKIELHTTVEEVIECEDVSGFLLKKVDLGKISLWTPSRAIYLSTDIPSRIRTKIIGVKEKSTLFEVNRIIYRDRSYEAIRTSLRESDEDRIKKLLKVNDSLSKENLSISMSFSDFPNLRIEQHRFEELLDYIHAYSSIVFVPHIRYGEAKTKVKYAARDFCEYVDRTVKTLCDMNAKPIFVPFDINYDAERRDQIFAHYANMGYTNLWIDFQGKVFSNTMVAKMRTLNRLINRFFGENARNVVMYLSNIKKVSRETQETFKISPSDVIGVFSYGDVVGAPWKGIVIPYQQSEEDVAYWERKGYSSEEEYKLAIFKRDCSIFENNSYYYWHPDRIRIRNQQLDEIRKSILQLGLSEHVTERKILVKAKSVAEAVSYTLSGLMTSIELNRLRRKVEEDRILLDYIEDKEFFKEEGSTILKRLKATKKAKVKERKEKEIFDFI